MVCVGCAVDYPMNSQPSESPAGLLECLNKAIYLLVGFCVQGVADWYPMGMEDQTESPTFPQEGAQPPQTIYVTHLQRKLKDAARKILSLRLEREQLLEMGNRLRAEQGHAKGKCLGTGR